MIITLFQLGRLFGSLALFAFGGGLGVLPDMQHAAVDVYHWLSNQQFLDLFTISRIMPGPGSLIVALIGEKAAGFPGALMALIAMFGPPAVVVYAVAKAWSSSASARWRQPLTRALAPVAVGLTLASGVALLLRTEHGALGYAITVVATASLAISKINPVVVIVAGGIVLLAGYWCGLAF